MGNRARGNLAHCVSHGELGEREPKTPASKGEDLLPQPSLPRYLGRDGNNVFRDIRASPFPITPQRTATTMPTYGEPRAPHPRCARGSGGLLHAVLPALLWGQGSNLTSKWWAGLA